MSCRAHILTLSVALGQQLGRTAGKTEGFHLSAQTRRREL